MSTITEEMLDRLREDILHKLSPKRFRHTVAVEEMVTRLCALYCPERTEQMRAAALLHDITKELENSQQERLCHAYGLPVTPVDRISPKTFHARTAAKLIPVSYPDFDDPVIVSAVRWHTTGHAGMTLTEQLLYLADYIDDSRTFQNCVILRRYFFGAEPQKMTSEERLALLRETMLLSYDMTIRDLLDEGKPIAEDTLQARNNLLLELAAQ
ncbi:MAG: HD domain-containing protein [Clostridia bacterium]|nr:HD domain-containing protein [Clostridia bacterium]